MLGLEKKVTGWAADQGKKIKENELEMEYIKTFQELLIWKLLFIFFHLRGLKTA